MATSAYFDLQRRIKLHDLSPRLHLPSLSEILPNHKHSEIDSILPPTSSVLKGPYLSRLSTSKRLNISTANSPVPEILQLSIMPESYDSYHRGHEPQYPSINYSRHGSSWVNGPQYPEIMSPYSTQQRSAYQGQSLPAPRLSPSLPPIRDIDPRMEKVNRHDPSYGSHGGQHPSMYHAGHPNTVNMEHSAYTPRRQSYYDNASKFGHAYQGTHNFQQSTSEFSRYGQQPMEPYRQTALPSPYSNLEYTSPTFHRDDSSTYGTTTESMDNRNRRRRGNLPKHVTDTLRAWFHEHLDHPYPSEEDKQAFIRETGLTMNQISNWFINARRRHLPALRNARDSGNSASIDRDQDLRMRPR